MKTFNFICLIFIFLTYCSDNSLKPESEVSEIRYHTDKELYNMSDQLSANVLNKTDSTIFVISCSSGSFGINMLENNSWINIRTIGPCLASNITYFEILPNDTLLLVYTLRTDLLIQNSGTYKFYTYFSHTISDLGTSFQDTLYSNVFDVLQ